MAARHLTVYKGKEEPRDKESFLWLRVDDINEPVLAFWDGETWVEVSGGGGGGGNIPLEHAYFYGGKDDKIVIDSDIETKVKSLATSSVRVNNNVPCNKKYFYLAVFSENNLIKVITENNENITSNFELDQNTFNITLSGQTLTYKLYEFHLNSDIPLNANLNITLA